MAIESLTVKARALISRCCPFGCADELIDFSGLLVVQPYGGDGLFAVTCVGCNCYGPLAKTEDASVEQWNVKEKV